MKKICTCKKLLLVFLSGFLFFSCSQKSSSPALSDIRVQGNDFVTREGKTIIFRGVNISDPDKLEKAGKWSIDHFREAKNWGANIIRIPVHPKAWRSRGPEKYLALLDKSIKWANELGLYLIIDWHSIGNLKTGKFQDESYVTTVEETHDFWKTISERYASQPALAMYELFNEPVNGGGKFGDLSWQEWKEMNIEMIHIIRQADPEAVVLVAGFNWAYDLKPVKDDPIRMPNIAYVSHPYPEKKQPPWENQWEEDWGFVTMKYPVILTEIGFALPDEKGVHIPVHGDETYGKAILDFAAQRGISWVAWCFDPNWSPVMFWDWNYSPSRQGTFFRNAMLQANQPMAK